MCVEQVPLSPLVVDQGSGKAELCCDPQTQEAGPVKERVRRKPEEIIKYSHEFLMRFSEVRRAQRGPWLHSLHCSAPVQPHACAA